MTAEKDPRNDAAPTSGWVEGKPSEPGWYATVHGWEPQEGAFPGAHYWDGTAWTEPATKVVILMWMAPAFPSQEEAHRWAYDHDPDM